MDTTNLIIEEPARKIPVRASVDVLVVGGGPSGIMAAQAAAADGLKVMLIENVQEYKEELLKGVIEDDWEPFIGGNFFFEDEEEIYIRRNY